MTPRFLLPILCAAAFKVCGAEPATPPSPAHPRQPDGNGAVSITGELKQWHKVTLTLDGPFAHERDSQPNPFTDLAVNVTFTHESGAPVYKVPGYFAADGDAANTGAEAGTKWRVHLSPDKPNGSSFADLGSASVGQGMRAGRPKNSSSQEVLSTQT